MKKLLLFLIFLMLFQSLVYAQFQKGSIMARGNVGYKTTHTERKNINPQFPNSDNRTENIWILLPGLGYFIKDNLALGAQGGMGGGTNSYSESRTVTRDFYAGIFLRKFLVMDEKFSFILEGYGNRVWGRPFFESSGGMFFDSKVDGWNTGISLGVHYMLSKKIGLELRSGILEYNTTNTYNLMSQTNISQSSEFDLNLLSNFGLGLNFFF
jgi:outer membrane protein W